MSKRVRQIIRYVCLTYTFLSPLLILGTRSIFFVDLLIVAAIALLWLKKEERTEKGN